MWMISHKTRFETEAKGNTESFVSVCLRLGELGGFVSTDCKLSAPHGIFRGFMARTRKKKRSLRVSSRGELCFCGGRGWECGNHNTKLSIWSVWFVSTTPTPTPPKNNYSLSPQSKQYRVLKITEVGRGWSTLWGMQLLLRKRWKYHVKYIYKSVVKRIGTARS